MSQEPRWEACAACFGQKVSWDAALTARFSMKAEMGGTNVPCCRVWVPHEHGSGVPGAVGRLSAILVRKQTEKLECFAVFSCLDFKTGL